jgi:iron(III) transport system permease protein
MTTSVQIIKGNMVQIGSELEEASYVTGASWAATFRRIVLPLLGPVLISAALLTFSSAARNVAAVVMIVSGRNRPIAMLQVDYMIDGQHERAAIIGVIIVALTLSVVWIARWVGKRAGFKTL